MANVTIDVAAQFKGKPAFDKAGNAVNGLEKTVNKLAKQFAGLFATDKIIAFGKASLKAFEEDQKSAAMLANTMKNLGMEFATPVLESYISRLSKTAAVADDELRPAMQKLLTQTGDYVKAQELLNQAIEISRGSGVDLATVTQDLANAYVGNTKGLKKYNLGLTQAELKTMSFIEIQKRLIDQFKGSNAAYLKTFAGQMSVLTVAAGEAKETIGKGLVDALALIGGDGSVQSLADAMESFANNTANAIYAIGQLVAKIKELDNSTPGWVKKLITLNFKVLFPGLGAVKNLLGDAEKERNSKLQNPSVQMFMTDEANNRLNNQKAKATKEQVKATKALTAEQKKQTLLKKQGTIFDMEQIQLVAALKGKLSDEERKRVELQLALLQGNEEEAKRLSSEIANSIDKTGNLAKYLQTLPDANNPFKNWSAYLDAIEAQAKRIASVTGGSTGGGGTTPPPSTNTDAMTWTVGGTAGANGGSYGGQVQVSVNFQGADSLSQALRDSFVSASMEGSFSQINRTVGAFDR